MREQEGAAALRRRNLLVGQRLQQERLLAGFTVDDLAAFLGIARGRLRGYESGAVPVEADRLSAAAALFQIPLSFLCYEVDRPLLHAADGGADRARRVAVPRPWSALGRDEFIRLRPVIKLWTERRGALSDDIDAALGQGGVRHRANWLRQLPRSSRVVIESCAPGLAFLKPCESLLLAGRDCHEMPDAAYGEWIAEAYAQTAQDERPRLQSVRAAVRTSDDTTVCVRYDRVLLPWQGRGNDRLVLGVSLQREISVLPKA